MAAASFPVLTTHLEVQDELQAGLLNELKLSGIVMDLGALGRRKTTVFSCCAPPAIVGECEMYKEERDVLEEEMRGK